MPNIPIDGYFIMPLDTLRIFHCIEPSDEDSNTFQMLLLPFKIYSDFHYYYENYYSDEFIYDDKLDDYYHHITFNCGEFDKKTLMYSRQQLDNIFNQSITNPLKSTIATLQNQLEQQANQPSDTATDDEILNYDEVKAIQAIKNEFWLDYDPKNKPVLKLVVTEWITQNYPSINPSMASWLDKIVRQKYVK